MAMRIVEPGHEALFRESRESVYKRLELIGRVCYKSEEKITDSSATEFVKMIVSRSHLAILEHASEPMLPTRSTDHARPEPAPAPRPAAHGGKIGEHVTVDPFKDP